MIGGWTTGGSYIVGGSGGVGGGVGIASSQWGPLSAPFPNSLQYACWLQTLRSTSSITRILTSVIVGNSYFVTYSAACRNDGTPGNPIYCSISDSQTFTVQLDGTTVYSTSPTLYSWQQFTSNPYVASSTSMVLMFQLSLLEGGTNLDVGIDAITVQQVVVPSGQPTNQPTLQPSTQPSSYPSYPSSQPSIQPSMQPSTQPSGQPTNLPSVQPSIQPTAYWGSFVGFSQYNCAAGCDPGFPLSLPTAAVANGWSSDTGGVNMICSNCAQNWWAIRPAFGSYTGNYAYLASATNSAAPWDTRLSYTFEGVTPGSSYYVGFWQKYRDAGAIASWTVTLGGTVVHNTLPQFPPYPEYINSASVVATSTSLTLVFEAINTLYDWRSVYLNGVTLTQRPNTPTGQPTQQPSGQPSIQPSSHPSIPSSQPSIQPTQQPTQLPTTLYNKMMIYQYTGIVQTYTVPVGVTLIQIRAAGASGGGGFNSNVWSTGGLGGCISTLLSVVPGQVYYVMVGGMGASRTSGYGIAHSSGGYNGGGSCNDPGTGEGGGGTDLRTSASDVTTRVVVSGGGE